MTDDIDKHKIELAYNVSKKYIGKTFNRLTVINVASPTKTCIPRVLCECVCGNKTVVCIYNLKSNHTRSCGCYAYESTTTHKMSRTVEYKTWHNIKSRCNNPNSTGYHYYGGRGISICDSWTEEDTGFLNFYKDMGDKPSNKHSIDRIDCNGDYCPENCRWATHEVQGNNKRYNHILHFDGQSKTISEWASVLKMKQNTLYYRIKRGWTIPEALGFDDRSIKYSGRLSQEDIKWMFNEIEKGGTQVACGKKLGIDSSQINRIYHKAIKDNFITKKGEENLTLS